LFVCFLIGECGRVFAYVYAFTTLKGLNWNLTMEMLQLQQVFQLQSVTQL